MALNWFKKKAKPTTETNEILENANSTPKDVNSVPEDETTETDIFIKILEEEEAKAAAASNASANEKEDKASVEDDASVEKASDEGVNEESQKQYFGEVDVTVERASDSKDEYFEDVDTSKVVESVSVVIDKKGNRVLKDSEGNLVEDTDEDVVEPKDKRVYMGLKECPIDTTVFPEDHFFFDKKVRHSFASKKKGLFDQVVYLMQNSEAESDKTLKEYGGAFNVFPDALAQDLIKPTALYITSVGTQLMQKYNGRPFVIISLNPENAIFGVALKDFFREKFFVDCPHFCVGITEEHGLDSNAMRYIWEKFGKVGSSKFQFVALHSGCGELNTLLSDSLNDIEVTEEDERYVELWDNLNDSIAYMSDPCGVSDICAIHDDFQPNFMSAPNLACGLVNLTKEQQGDGFFTAAYNPSLIEFDVTNKYSEMLAEEISKISVQMIPIAFQIKNHSTKNITENVEDIARAAVFAGEDDQIVCGMTAVTKALLDKKIDTIIFNPISKKYDGLKHIRFIVEAHQMKTVETEKLGSYKVCALLK